MIISFDLSKKLLDINNLTRKAYALAKKKKNKLII